MTSHPAKQLSFVEVKTLSQALEMRLVRNDCRKFMTRHTEHISPVDQLRWFTDVYLPKRLKNRMLGVLAFAGKDVAGYGLAYLETGTAKISGGLRPDFRGQGYGVPLFEKIIERARTLEAAHVELEVRSDNERAKALYRKLGFQTLFEVNGIEVMRL